MQSTDTGDYFPEGYNPEEEIAFTSGMMGSQSMGQRNDGPELPGLENLGADAVMSGGIELDSDIPAGMELKTAYIHGSQACALEGDLVHVLRLMPISKVADYS